MKDRIFAIGDIHGCSKALAALLDAIRPTQSDTLVFLGDFFNRGPDSKGVLDQLLVQSERCKVVPLLGNHEEMLLAVLDGGQSEIKFWLTFGGDKALASYGWKGSSDVRPADVRNLVPREHIEFIKGCRDYFETDRHFFAHAYYGPNLPLNQQKWSSLRWASLPLIPERHCSGKIAIIGHTEQENGEILDLGFLKCIDTFCYGGGWLTAVEVGTGQVYQANTAGELRD